MDIFISWSGDRSKFIAETLKEWLPKVIQLLKPWVSSSDVTKGSRWQIELAQRLENTNFGIICLTPENMNEPWIQFESGALSKTIGTSHVCPILFDLSPADIAGPLAQFQLTKLCSEDIYNLLKTINQLLERHALSEEQIQETFNKWWPDLEETLEEIPGTTTNKLPRRDDRELLEEILFLARESTKNPYLVEREFLYGRLQYFLAGLTPREELVLRLLYGLMGEEKTFTIKEVATRLKVTQKAIKEMHTNALQGLMKIIVKYLNETT